MIKAIVRDLIEEIQTPQVQKKLQDAILSPVLRYVLYYFAPYFIIVTLLIVVVIILLIINLFKR